MDAFSWDKYYLTGISEVDKQHHHLVDIINTLSAILTQPEDAAHDKIETIFDNLASYTHYHFKDEEVLMGKSKIDIRHFAPHHQAHIDFLQEITQQRASFSHDEPDKANKLLKFLINWLAYHILGSDQSMAKQIAAIRGGQSPANAYLEQEQEQKGAVEPLLHALNGMFRQVSERNRELLELNRTLEKRVIERTKELALANHQLKTMALTDVLTGLPNRRYGIQCLAQLWDESSMGKTPFACIMIDADGFKQINDKYGHNAGDEVLRQLAKNLRYELRNDDILCRLGGDEFLVLCPDTPLEGAYLLAEKLHTAIAALNIPAGAGVWHGSISVGVAVRSNNMSNFDMLIKAADDAVYIAKNSGKNCVATAPGSISADQGSKS